MLDLTFGKVIKMNESTGEACYGNFARLCVKLNLKKPLVSEFELDGKVHTVEYKGMRDICFTCGEDGHSKDKCPSCKVAGDDGGKQKGQSSMHERGQSSTDGLAIVHRCQ